MPRISRNATRTDLTLPALAAEPAAETAGSANRSLLATSDALGVRTQRGQWWLAG